MQEVRIYDEKGNLKKIITPKILEKRSQLICSALVNEKRILRSKLLKLQKAAKKV